MTKTNLIINDGHGAYIEVVGPTENSPNFKLYLNPEERVDMIECQISDFEELLAWAKQYEEATK